MVGVVQQDIAICDLVENCRGSSGAEVLQTRVVDRRMGREIDLAAIVYL